jgi:Superinfection immunity protein
VDQPLSGADIAGIVLVSIGLAVAYLGPAIAALVRRSRHLVAAVLVDVLLGWTGIGWVAAWILAFSGGRRGDGSPLPYGMLYPPFTGLSPDGLWWWDGAAWRDTRAVVPPWAQRSGDGAWWWDGWRWRPVPPAPVW